MQSMNEYEPHRLSKQFVDQFNQSKANLNAAYRNVLAMLKTLKQTYPNAFDPFLRPAWHDNLRQLGGIKKQIAKEIVAAAEKFENSAQDPYFFMIQIDIIKEKLAGAVTENHTAETTDFFGWWGKQSADGTLGLQLRAFQKMIETVSQRRNDFISQYMHICKERLNYLHTALAIVREKIIVLEQTDEGVVSNDNVPFQNHHEYHFQSYLEKNLNTSFNDSELMNFVKQKIIQDSFVLVDGEYSRQIERGNETEEELRLLETQCLHLIHDVKLVLFEVFLLDWIVNESVFKTEKIDIESAIKRFLITDFIYQLPFIEKEYWWRLIVQAHHIGRGKHIQEVTVGKQYYFYARDEFWDFLINCYTSNPTIYANSPTIALLNNGLLGIWCAREQFIKSSALEKAFIDAIEDNDIPLNKMLAKKVSNPWKRLHGDALQAGYPRCHWKNEVQAEFRQTVIDPLMKAHTMVMNKEADESSYLGQLFLRADAYIKVMAGEQLTLQGKESDLVDHGFSMVY